MLPYSRGLIIDNTNNYGIVKTETVFGFGPKGDNYLNNTFNSTEPLEWLFTHGNFGKDSLPESFQTGSESRSLKDTSKPATKTTPPPPPQQRSKKLKKKIKKKLRRKAKKSKKCIFKVINKKKKNKGKYKMQKKYMMPLILGLLAAKSLLIPIAMKALAFLSAKGLMMGFFSTVMASVLSLKGMFDHNHYYGNQNRKDDTKTQVEIIQVPSKSEDHVYYDDHYRRGDYIPNIFRAEGYPILKSIAYEND